MTHVTPPHSNPIPTPILSGGVKYKFVPVVSQTIVQLVDKIDWFVLTADLPVDVLTLNMPSNPVDGQIVNITSLQPITVLQFTATLPHHQATNPIELGVFNSATLMFVAADPTNHLATDTWLLVRFP